MRLQVCTKQLNLTFFWNVYSPHSYLYSRLLQELKLVCNKWKSDYRHLLNFKFWPLKRIYSCVLCKLNLNQNPFFTAPLVVAKKSFMVLVPARWCQTSHDLETISLGPTSISFSSSSKPRRWIRARRTSRGRTRDWRGFGRRFVHRGRRDSNTENAPRFLMAHLHMRLRPIHASCVCMFRPSLIFDSTEIGNVLSL